MNVFFILSLVMVVLSVAGGIALCARVLRSLARLGFTVAEGTAASGLAEVSARHGDITGMAERQQLARSLRRARRREGLLAVVWVALLVVPIFLGMVREVYAACALLWFLRDRRLFPRRLGGGPAVPTRQE